MRWIWDSLDLDTRGAVDRVHWVGITESVCAGPEYGLTYRYTLNQYVDGNAVDGEALDGMR